MRHPRHHRRNDPETGPGARLASAFVSMLFSAPLIGLLWLLLNFLGASSDTHVPLTYPGAAIAGFAALSFAFPRLAPDLFGWLGHLLVRMGRWL